MERDSRSREAFTQMLDLVHKDREWIERGDEESFGVAAEKNLELRLAPPGENWFINENSNKNNNYNRGRDKSPLSLGCFSSMVSKTHGNNGNQNQKLSLQEKQTIGNVFTSPWSSGTSPSHSAFQMKTQKQPMSSYIHFQSIPQSQAVMINESSHSRSTKVVAELQNHQEKKACSPASVSIPANTAVNNSSQKRTAPVVGWPPIRSFRKNLASSSSSKLAPQSQNEVTHKEASKGLFIKINMDGVPIGRKVDLKAYDSYEKLSSAVDELFRDLLKAQRDSPSAGNRDNTVEVEEITGLLDGSGEYTLVYEDNEGDRMLVGDVPWHMFASTVKRLRVLKSSELPVLRLGSRKQENIPT